MSSCDHAGLEPEIFFDIIYEEDRYHLISPRKFLLTDGSERLQRLQFPDLQSFGLRPEVVLVFLIELAQFRVGMKLPIEADFVFCFIFQRRHGLRAVSERRCQARSTAYRINTHFPSAPRIT